MNIRELDELISILNPGCDEDTLFAVRTALMCELVSKDKRLHTRTDQQKVDIFETPIANDPRDW